MTNHVYEKLIVSWPGVHLSSNLKGLVVKSIVWHMEKESLYNILGNQRSATLLHIISSVVARSRTIPVVKPVILGVSGPKIMLNWGPLC